MSPDPDAPAPRWEVPPDLLREALEAGLATGGDFCELFREDRASRFLRLEEGSARSIRSGRDAGAGLRVIAGDRTGYASTDGTDAADLLGAARAAAGIAAGAGPVTPARCSESGRPAAGAPPDDPAFGSSLEDSIALARRIDRHARAADPRVTQVIVTLSEQRRAIQVANSEGLLVSESQGLLGVTVLVVVESKGRRERGQYAGSARDGASWLVRVPPESMAQEAVRRGLVLLDSVDAPAGRCPVVIGNGWGGVLLHEAVGHGFEADFVRRGTSVFHGQEGKPVASPLCTVIDDASLPGLRGSFGVDDEGEPGRPTVLIEGGRLSGFLHDRLSARLMGAAATGNGRRESYRTPPIPRQTNLYLARGEDDPEEIIRSVERGFYARHIGGGQVDITNGNFVFQVTEGYRIESGRITAPVRNANLMGTGQEVLRRVTRVGSDLQFDEGQGTCGKEGQSVPVGVGQPTVLVSELTVGGTGL